MEQAELTKERDEQLLKLNLKADLDVKLSVAKWEQLAGKYKMEKQKLDIHEGVRGRSARNRPKVQVESSRPSGTLKKQQVDELTIRAGIAGRMQEMTLQVGQRVKPGDVLAKIAQPSKLMARAEDRRNPGEGHSARPESAKSIPGTGSSRGT